LAILKEKEDYSQTPINYEYNKVIGQIWGSFNVQDSLYKRLSNKYTREWTIKDSN
jgi:hypothetical protein